MIQLKFYKIHVSASNTILNFCISQKYYDSVIRVFSVNVLKILVQNVCFFYNFERCFLSFSYKRDL